MVKSKAGKEKKSQATEFKITECCSSVVVQRAARRKNDCVSGVSCVTGTLGKANKALTFIVNVAPKLFKSINSFATMSASATVLKLFLKDDICQMTGLLGAAAR